MMVLNGRNCQEKPLNMIKIEVNEKQLQVILNGLGELKLKDALPVLQHLQEEVSKNNTKSKK